MALGHKQKKALLLAQRRGGVVNGRLFKKYCGGKTEARRVLSTLENRGLLAWQSHGSFRITSEGESVDVSDVSLKD